MDAGSDELDVGPGRGVELQPLERDDVGASPVGTAKGTRLPPKRGLEKALFHPELRMKVGDIGIRRMRRPARRGDSVGETPIITRATASGLKM